MKFKPRSLEKLAARRPRRIDPRRGEKCPPGYTKRYVWPDSDYVTHRRAVFVRKETKKGKK